MALVAPSGPMYQAGTLSGNPLAMAAGLATLAAIESDAGLYRRLEALGAELERGIADAIQRGGHACRLARVGSMWTLFMSAEEVLDWDRAATCDRERFARFFRAMLARGISLAPSQFEACFLSAAHDEADVAATIAACGQALREADA
jgi:glutamate-1-semialdehyde 2,1-aminomutase